MKKIRQALSMDSRDRYESDYYDQQGQGGQYDRYQQQPSWQQQRPWEQQQQRPWEQQSSRSWEQQQQRPSWEQQSRPWEQQQQQGRSWEQQQQSRPWEQQQGRSSDQGRSWDQQQRRNWETVRPWDQQQQSSSWDQQQQSRPLDQQQGQQRPWDQQQQGQGQGQGQRSWDQQQSRPWDQQQQGQQRPWDQQQRQQRSWDQQQNRPWDQQQQGQQRSWDQQQQSRGQEQRPWEQQQQSSWQQQRPLDRDQQRDQQSSTWQQQQQRQPWDREQQRQSSWQQQQDQGRQQFQVLVPEGVEAGSSFVVRTPDNNLYMVPVPSGTTPGQAISIKVPSRDQSSQQSSGIGTGITNAISSALGGGGMRSQQSSMRSQGYDVPGEHQSGSGQGSQRGQAISGYGQSSSLSQQGYDMSGYGRSSQGLGQGSSSGQGYGSSSGYGQSSSLSQQGYDMSGYGRSGQGSGQGSGSGGSSGLGQSSGYGQSNSLSQQGYDMSGSDRQGGSGGYGGSAQGQSYGGSGSQNMQGYDMSGSDRQSGQQQQQAPWRQRLQQQQQQQPSWQNRPYNQGRQQQGDQPFQRVLQQYEPKQIWGSSQQQQQQPSSMQSSNRPLVSAIPMSGQQQDPLQQAQQQIAQPQQQSQSQAYVEAFVPWKSFQGTAYAPVPLRTRQAEVFDLKNTEVRPTGRTKALIVGINYIGSRVQLKGSINDAYSMRAFLLRHGFTDSPSTMLVLTDDASDEDYVPTKDNLIKAMQWLVQGAAPGDSLFFHFSGHGAQQPDYVGIEKDGLNETLLPCDFEYSGQVPDDTIWDTIVAPLPCGCRLTAVIDCCYCGAGIDLPYLWSPQTGWEEETNPCHAEGDVELFSGIELDSPTGDTYERFAAGGAVTTAFISAFEGLTVRSYPDLVASMQRSIASRGFSQRPLLSASQRFDLHGKQFELTNGFVPNTNPVVGKLQRTHFRAAHPNFKGTVLEDVLNKQQGQQGQQFQQQQQQSQQYPQSQQSPQGQQGVQGMQGQQCQQYQQGQQNQQGSYPIMGNLTQGPVVDAF